MWEIESHRLCVQKRGKIVYRAATYILVDYEKTRTEGGKTEREALFCLSLTMTGGEYGGYP
jgi:hypothetical protein